MNSYILHLSILFVVLVFGFWFYIDTLRVKAKFDLYKIRDQFIFHVASGKIKEDGKLFQFYYTAINSLLREAPNVGIDDIIQVIPRESDHLKKVRKDSISSIFSDPEMEDKDVRETVSCFFGAILLMILSHSSITRFFYIFAIRIVAPVMNRINHAVNNHVAAAAIAAVAALFIVPGVARRGLETINYVAKMQQQETHLQC